MNPGWRTNYLRYKSYFLNVVGRYRERADILAYMEILLSLATVSIFSIFALRPTLMTIAGLTREIDSKKEVLQKMTDKIRDISQAQSLYDRQRAKIVLLKSAIPTDPQPDVFMRQILGVSARSGAEVTGISTGGITLLPIKTVSSDQSSVKETATPDETGQGGISFSVQTQSAIENYSSLSAFLTQIENLRRPLSLGSLSLAVAAQKEEKSLVLGISGTLPYLGQ